VAAGQDQFQVGPGFELAGAVVHFLVVVCGVVAVVGLARTDGGGGYAALWGLWTVGAVAQGWWHFFRMPHRIEVTDGGLRFVARRRVVEIPWSALQSVSIPLYDLGRHTLLWRWDGRKLHSWRRVRGLDRLFRAVENRAPNAKLLV